MTKENISWRNAALPPKTAVFAVGDIHGHSDLLQPMLDGIKEKIAVLPSDTTAHVIFIGDYIDRGIDSPKTIQMLIDFERGMVAKQNVKTTYLCGNHEMFLKWLLEAPQIVDEPQGSTKKDHDCVPYADGTINIKGLEDWLFKGGGYTTLKDYFPEVDMSLFDLEKKQFNRAHPDFSIEKVNALVKNFVARVPETHKDFFKRVYDNSHIIVGDYLFTHAGIDPKKTLAEQGIGDGVKPLDKKDYFDFLMFRNPFLWRNDNNLPNCPYVVVHGHTPSEIRTKINITTPQASGPTIVDGQKDYRLCIDTHIYKPEGALTCFVRTEDQASFMAVNKESPESAIEYSVPVIGQHLAALYHTKIHPEYHTIGRVL